MTISEREDLAAQKLSRRFACGLMKPDEVTGRYTIVGRGVVLATDLTLEDVEGWIEDGRIRCALSKVHN